MITQLMTQRQKFAWSFIRRHRALTTNGMDANFYNDMCALCHLEIVTALVTDEYPDRIGMFVLKYAGDAI